MQSAPLQAEVMALIARETDTLAAISLMDLSVEAEAFGAQVRFSQNEVPAVLGQLISCEEEADAIEIPALDAGRIPVFVDAIRLAKAKIPDKLLLYSEFFQTTTRHTLYLEQTHNIVNCRHALTNHKEPVQVQYNHRVHR